MKPVVVCLVIVLVVIFLLVLVGGPIIRPCQPVPIANIQPAPIANSLENVKAGYVEPRVHLENNGKMRGILLKNTQKLETLIVSYNWGWRLGDDNKIIIENISRNIEIAIPRRLVVYVSGHLPGPAKGGRTGEASPESMARHDRKIYKILKYMSSMDTK